MSSARFDWLFALAGCMAGCTAMVLAGAIMVRSHRAQTPIAPMLHSQANDQSQAASSNPAPNSASRCESCHSQIARSMANAPHWNTLSPASNRQVMQRFTGRIEVDEGASEYEFYERGGELWCRSNQAQQDVRIDWVFGSGSHAQTPVSLQRNSRGQIELIEHRISWYPNHGLGLTLGQTEVEPSSSARAKLLGMQHHGAVHKSGPALACMSCHSKGLDPQQLDSQLHVKTGLGCRRCHPGAEDHADVEEGARVELSEIWSQGSWRQLSQRESVNRCGECHRRADQTPRDEINVEAEHIVRFASVGLVQSKCFLATENDPQARLDCLTCHDPHRPASRDAAFYSAKCQACHQSVKVATCPQAPKSKDCVSCHMRRRETQPLLIFTDHWIRR